MTWAMASDSISIKEYNSDPVVWTCVEYDSCYGDTYNKGWLAYKTHSVWTVMTGSMNDDDKSFEIMKHATHDSVDGLKQWINENQLKKTLFAGNPSINFETWYKRKHLPCVKRVPMPDDRIDTGTVYIYNHGIFRDKWLALEALFKSNDWVSQGIRTYNIDTQTSTATWYPMNLTDDELDKVAQNNNSLKASIDDIKTRRAELLSRAQAVHSASQKALAAHPKWLHHAMI